MMGFRCAQPILRLPFQKLQFAAKAAMNARCQIHCALGAFNMEGGLPMKRNRRLSLCWLAIASVFLFGHGAVQAQQSGSEKRIEMHYAALSGAALPRFMLFTPRP